MDGKQLKRSVYLKDLEQTVKDCEAIRKDTHDPQDISLAEMVELKYDTGMDSFYDDMGINPNVDTIQNLVNMPDPALRWLIPEIFRDAVRLGLRKNPIYPNVIAAEQSVAQTQITMPAINMSEAKPKKVGIAETITTGDVSFASKNVKIYKYGRGIKVPYEVIQYVSINLVSLWLQDFGVQLRMGIDTMMINTLLNGDQTDGSDSIAVIGIATAGTLIYKDLLKAWVRAGRLGKNFTTIIAGEAMAIELLDMMNASRLLGAPQVNLSIKSPIPQSADVFVHGAVPANVAIFVDPSSAIIKLNAQPLLVETDKIISNQTQETFCTLTTGFTTVYRDSRMELDMSKTYAGFPFPTWMDPALKENYTFD